MILIGHRDDGNITFFCSDVGSHKKVIDTLSGLSPMTFKGNTEIVYLRDKYRDQLNKRFGKIKDEISFDSSYMDWKSKLGKILIKSGPVKSKIDQYPAGFPEKEIDKELSFFIEGAKHSQLFKQKKWDGYIHLYKKKTKEFPTGLLFLVEKILQKNKMEDVEVKYTYNRFPKREFNWKIKKLFEPTKDQLNAIEIIKKNPRGVVKAATGFGDLAYISL